MHRIHLRKESYKFAAAHMTVFPDGTKEGLHGHHYSTEVSVQYRDSGALADMIPVAVFKDTIKELCAAWDEKVLLPKLCPFLERIGQNPEEVEFLLCSKRYVIPAEEVIFLEVENVTMESLSALFLKSFLDRLPKSVRKRLTEVYVRIDESPGQGASTTWERPEHAN